MQYADRVKETSTSTGTGNLTLGGAVTGYRTFAAAVAAALPMIVVIQNSDESEWEVSEATHNGSNTLTRTRVIASSNGGSAVNFSAGDKVVFLTFAAEQITDRGVTHCVAAGFFLP